MKTNSRNWLTRALMLGLCLSLLVLAGCNPEGDTNVQKEPPKPVVPEYTERIVLQPDTSDEFQRIYRTKPNGSKHSLKIDYRDGTSTIEYYRPDGTVSEVKEYHAHLDDKLKSHTKFDTEGNPISKDAYRVNGRLESSTEFLADGTKKIAMYKVDGKRLHSETLERQDGSKSEVYYRTDGKTLWAKVEWKNSRNVTVEYYDATGKLDQTRVKTQNSRDITVFDDSGKAIYRQHYTGYWSTYSYYAYSSYQLIEVEELEDDGQTVKRRIFVERYSNKRVKRIEYLKDGEVVKEQELNYDGSVKFEKTLKDDGTWDTQSPEFGEVPSEPVAPELLTEPDYDDPLTNNPNNFL